MEFEIVDLTSEAELSQSKSGAVCASPFSHTSPSPHSHRRTSFAKPWWNRLPHFVPVAAISYDDVDSGTGIDPRTGETVFVDYLHQFAGGEGQPEKETRPSAAGEKSTRQKSIATERLSATSVVPDGGEWVTNARGKQVFRTNDGKEYSGMKAYEMHAKMAEREARLDFFSS